MISISRWGGISTHLILKNLIKTLWRVPSEAVDPLELTGKLADEYLCFSGLQSERASHDNEQYGENRHPIMNLNVSNVILNQIYYYCDTQRITFFHHGWMMSMGINTEVEDP